MFFFFFLNGTLLIKCVSPGAPGKGSNITEDAYKTLFIGRLRYFGFPLSF